MRGHMWLNKVASVLGPLTYFSMYKKCFNACATLKI